MTAPALPSSEDTRAALAWAAIAALAAMIMVFLKGPLVLGDPDTQWHIAAGRLMWETGQMPRVDTMSHTYAGQPWIAKEWLGQVLIFGVHAVAGWPGLLVFSAICVAACVAIIARRLLEACPPFLALMVLWVSINSLLGITTTRPHVIALPVMALFTVMLLNAAERDQSPPWLALPVMTLWANIHAAFTLGFVVAAFLALDALLRAAPERRLRLALLWGAFGVGLVAAACVHPYGPQSILINIDMAKGNESIPLITEWYRHEIFGVTWFRIVIPALLVASLAFAGWRNLSRLALGVFMVYLTWRHQRFIMLLAVVAPMITRDAFVAAVRSLAARRNLFQGLDPLRDPSWRAPAAIGCLAAFAALPFVAEKAEPPGMSAPVEALRSVPPDVRATPVYNSYNFGGFLVMQGVPTFIDGRTDQLFTNDFMARMFRYIEAGDRASFMAFVEGRGARWALVQTNQKELPFFESSPDWRETYADEHAKVFVRAGR
jgi:hypothetical protein